MSLTTESPRRHKAAAQSSMNGASSFSWSHYGPTHVCPSFPSPVTDTVNVCFGKHVVVNHLCAQLTTTNGRTLRSQVQLFFAEQYTQMQPEKLENINSIVLSSYYILPSDQSYHWLKSFPSIRNAFRGDYDGTNNPLSSRREITQAVAVK